MKESIIEKSTVSLDGIKRILVKFFFTNADLVPPGIRQQKRLSDAEMDEIHAKQNPEKGQKGRVRFGRVDTGEHFIDNLQSVGASILPVQLAKAGYGAVDIHTFIKEGRPKKNKQGGYSQSQKKHVVSVTFQKGSGSEMGLGLSEDQNKVLVSLFNGGETSWVCHGYKNRGAENMTLNFMNIKRENPRLTLATTDRGKIMVIENDPSIVEEFCQ